MGPILVLLALIAVTDPPPDNLKVTFAAPPAPSRDQPVTWRVKIENISGAELPPTKIYFRFYPGRIQSLDPELPCSPQTDGGYSCDFPTFEAGGSREFVASVQHPFRYGRTSASVGASYVYVYGMPESHSSVVTYWLDFPVTTSADAGPGSLRQTIHDVNSSRDCRLAWPEWSNPCRVVFDIADPLPSEGWYTIRLRSPLPPMLAYDMGIDGTTQTSSRPGPAIFIDGSSLPSGHGLVADSAGIGSHAEIRGLAIGGFPGDGIHVTVRSEALVEGCYVGVDPTGSRAHPNGLRGISSETMRGWISNNVISGNRRSGVFFMGQPSVGPQIRDNRIGVAAHDDTPIGNGASGIFIADFWGAYNYPSIAGNVIANNADFGVALTANAPMLILANSIRNNGQGGIDIGLDGPTLSAPGVPGVERGVIPVPVIQSAIYKDGVTTIKGIADAGNNRREVYLYANSTLEADGFAEGEQFLGKTSVTHRENTGFTFEYPGDLRGKFINGNAVAVTFWGWDEYAYTSSEFGRAVPVEDGMR